MRADLIYEGKEYYYNKYFEDFSVAPGVMYRGAIDVAKTREGMNALAKIKRGQYKLEKKGLVHERNSALLSGVALACFPLPWAIMNAIYDGGFRLERYGFWTFTCLSGVCVCLTLGIEKIRKIKKTNKLLLVTEMVPYLSLDELRNLLGEDLKISAAYNIPYKKIIALKKVVDSRKAQEEKIEEPKTKKLR